MPEVVLGVLLVAGCALAAVVWQSRHDSVVTIVVAARPIARGTVITANDLRDAGISGDTSGLIVGGRADSLLGEVAVVPIDSGTPLTSALVTSEGVLMPGEALTSGAFGDGAMPPDLAKGDSVRVVVTKHQDGQPTTTAMLADTFVVWSVDIRSDTAPVVVTLRGPVSLAVDIAGATAVQLVRVPGS